MEKDDIETLTKGFNEHHEAMKAALAAEKKEREALEARLNLAGLTGRREDGETGQLREVGEALRAYIKAGSKDAIADLLQKSGMSSGSDPEGGYTVIPAFSSSITKRVYETSPMRRLARVVSISTDALEELEDLDEAESGWVAERQPRTDTGAPDLGKFKIPVHEIYAMPKATQSLLDDSMIDIGAWLVDKVSDRFARQEGAAFVTGTGVGKPRGFLDEEVSAEADDVRAWGKLQFVVSGGASDFAASNPGDALMWLQDEMKADYRPGAVWMMNRRTAGTIRRFKDGQGNYLWANSIQVGQPPTLLGHPVELNEDMPAVGSGAFPVAFGNFRRGYTVVDRHGLRLLRDPYTDKPNVRFYCYRRVGGRTNNFEAIKLLKIAAS